MYRRTFISHPFRILQTLTNHVCRFFLLILFFLIANTQVQAEVVGATPGRFSVNANGAATYTIPIQVPPGINGMEPNLALSYNSKQDNGLFGVGWSLSGLSTIQRCAASLAIEGFREGIDFTAQRFCFNGQRLLIDNTDQNPAYVAYRTKNESFSRIRAYGEAGAPTYFQVWTKSGRIQWFGNTADSKLNPQQFGVLVWALNQVQDRNGNTLTVTYENDSTVGSYYPSRIDYTQNGALASARAVIFGTEDRADAITKYVAGAKVSTGKRINTVTTQFNATTVRTYILNYEDETDTASSSKRSRLRSVQECGLSDAECLPATVFNWYDGGSATFTASSTDLPLSDSRTTENDAFSKWHRIVDINSDGLPDLFEVLKSPFEGDLSANVKVAHGLPGGGYAEGVYTIEVATYAEEGFSYRNELADFNRDGILDILRVVVNQNETTALDDIHIHYGQADGTYESTARTILSAALYTNSKM